MNEGVSWLVVAGPPVCKLTADSTLCVVGDLPDAPDGTRARLALGRCRTFPEYRHPPSSLLSRHDRRSAFTAIQNPRTSTASPKTASHHTVIARKRPSIDRGLALGWRWFVPDRAPAGVACVRSTSPAAAFVLRLAQWNRE